MLHRFFVEMVPSCAVPARQEPVGGASVALDARARVEARADTDGGVILLGVKEVGGKFSITGVPNATALIKRFWDCANNREKVSVNILFDRHVDSVKCRGRDVVVIDVPRADRQDRPVYIGKDMFSGSFGAMAREIITARASL